MERMKGRRREGDVKTAERELEEEKKRCSDNQTGVRQSNSLAWSSNPFYSDGKTETEPAGNDSNSLCLKVRCNQEVCKNYKFTSRHFFSDTVTIRFDGLQAC